MGVFILRSSKAIPGPLDEPDFDRTLEDAILKDTGTILPFENVTRFVPKRRSFSPLPNADDTQSPSRPVTKDMPSAVWVLSFCYALMLLVVALALKQIEAPASWRITSFLCGCMLMVSHGILAQTFYTIPRLALVHGAVLAIVDYHLADHFTSGSIPFFIPFMALALHLFLMGIVPDGTLRAGHRFLKSYQIGQWVVLCFFASIIALGCMRIPNETTWILAMLPMLHSLICVTCLLTAYANKAFPIPCWIVCSIATLAYGLLQWQNASVNLLSDSSGIDLWLSPAISLFLLVVILHGRTIVHSTQLQPTDHRPIESLAV